MIWSQLLQLLGWTWFSLEPFAKEPQFVWNAQWWPWIFHRLHIRDCHMMWWAGYKCREGGVHSGGAPGHQWWKGLHYPVGRRGFDCKETSIWTVVVPQEKLLLCKAEILVGSSQDGVNTDVLIESKKRAFRPKASLGDCSVGHMSRIGKSPSPYGASKVMLSGRMSEYLDMSCSLCPPTD